LLNSIIIPKGVLVLGENCFADCSKLSSVVFEPDSVLEQIGASAFSECTSLTSLCLRASLTVLSAESLCGITSLTSLTFAAGSRLSEIQSSAFAHCDSLTSLFLPASLSLIDGSSFLDSNPFYFVTGPFLLSRTEMLLIRCFGPCARVTLSYAFRSAWVRLSRRSAAAPSSANASSGTHFHLHSIAGRPDSSRWALSLVPNCCRYALGHSSRVGR
jgi:hypothetical protein